MDRMLLISGDIVTMEEPLRRRVLRFTGSSSATSGIVKRIDAAKRAGPVMSFMVMQRSPAPDAQHDDESKWDVRVSYAAAATQAGSDA